ncbi:hypothetical protein B0T16DRAFT_388448 [Cercophora newfieldiana]|uniref:Peptidase S1 domain-containing protein n=1 Tax=Cercophora newfieldiana TaxID=92897 RepID=A0AA39Y9F0_9PEZI|nr:hypothetical protein B0T16DRAFT_388448 [Cercophora newfieldiana]
MRPGAILAVAAAGHWGCCQAALSVSRQRKPCALLPIPERTTIGSDALTEAVREVMPDFITGFGGVPSFTPNNTSPAWDLAEPETQLFEDPHIEQFLRIAPQSARLFTRHQLPQTTRMKHPFSTLGKALMRDGELQTACSGVLVGTNLLLTAVECIQNKTNEWALEFVPGFHAEDREQPRPWGSAFADRCVSTDSPASAYAICRLSRPIGTMAGYLGWRASPNNGFYLGGDWLSVGYPANFKAGNVPTLEIDVRILAVESVGGSINAKRLSSQPYSENGWSGGPLFGQDGDDFFVVGVVAAVGAEEGPYGHIFATSSVHVGGVEMGELIEYGRMEWGFEA